VFAFAGNLRLAAFGVAICVVAVAAGSLSSPRPASAGHGCAAAGSPAGPFNLTAYEASDWKNTYARALEYAGLNQLFPELSSFRLPPLETGSRSSGSTTTTAPHVPPAILKAIAWIESNWQMGASSVPYGGVGPPLLSHSCAYGISQIVSGMENTGSPPTLDQTSIGSHFGLNIAKGAAILGGKWNLAPEYRPIVGNRDPTRVENWYYAIWSYHGFSFTNHPLNPAYSPQRGTFQCNGTQSYNSFPYQELVLGCVKNPPVVGGSRLWDPISVSMPSLSSPAFNLTAWNNCWASYSCDSMDFSTPSPSHGDPTVTTGSRSSVLGNPVAALSATSVATSVKLGTNSSPVSVTVSNVGTGPLSWRLSPSVNWIALSRMQGVSLGTDLGSVPANFQLSIKAEGLLPGNYSGTINLQSRYSQGLPLAIAVHLTVLPKAAPQMLGADVNGDGMGDVVGVYDYGNGLMGIWNFISNGSSFSRVERAYTGKPGAWELSQAKMLVADVNGDGKDDVVGIYDYGNGLMGMWNFSSNGTSFSSVQRVYIGKPGAWDVKRSQFAVADLNGDAKDDIAGIYDYGGGVIGIFDFVSDGVNLTPVRRSYAGCGGCWQLDVSRFVGADVNGDGKDDLVGIYDYGSGSMGMWSFVSNGSGFSAIQRSYSGCNGCWWLSRAEMRAADLNGDGRDDILGVYDYGAGLMGMWNFVSTGTSFSSVYRSYVGNAGAWELGRAHMLATNVNGDGTDDIVGVYDYGNGTMGMWNFLSNGANFAGVYPSYMGKANAWHLQLA
jgi:hypothetical protein